MPSCAKLGADDDGPEELADGPNLEADDDGPEELADGPIVHGVVTDGALPCDRWRFAPTDGFECSSYTAKSGCGSAVRISRRAHAFHANSCPQPLKLSMCTSSFGVLSGNDLKQRSHVHCGAGLGVVLLEGSGSGIVAKAASNSGSSSSRPLDLSIAFWLMIISRSIIAEVAPVYEGHVPPPTRPIIIRLSAASAAGRALHILLVLVRAVQLLSVTFWVPTMAEKPAWGRK